MQTVGIIGLIFVGIYACFWLLFAYKTGKTFKTIILCMMLGLGCFTALNATAAFTGVSIAVNPWTMGSSAVFGIPGIVVMLVMPMFF